MLEPARGRVYRFSISFPVHTKPSVEIFGRKLSMFVRFSYETFAISRSPLSLTLSLSPSLFHVRSSRAVSLLNRRDARLAISFRRHFGSRRVATAKICNSIEKPEVGNAGRQCEITPGYTLPIKC